MGQQDNEARNTAEHAESAMRDTGDTSSRADEEGDVAEPDAPTRVQENAGMSTILDGGTGTGVQTDASDE